MPQVGRAAGAGSGASRATETFVHPGLDSAKTPRMTEALEELESGAGSQFDPSIARAMIELVREGTLVLSSDDEQSERDEEIGRSRGGVAAGKG